MRHRSVRKRGMERLNKKQRIDLIREMEKELGYGRFIHSLGVADIAAGLAMRYGIDQDRAFLAGILHDCAKCMSLSKMRKVCEKAGMELSSFERESTALLHSKAGCVLARTRYGVTDEDLLNAIAYHTTGRPAMSLLEKIIFTSDYIEPGRDTAPHLATIRRMAFENIDACVLEILRDTLAYLETGNGEVDPMTKETFEYYANIDS